MLEAYVIKTENGDSVQVTENEEPALAEALAIWRATSAHSGLKRAAWCNVLERAGEVLDDHGIDDPADDVDAIHG